MKTVYIPKGETVHYESLVTEHLVVKGCLNVTYGVKAKTISGDGVICAGSVEADIIRIDSLEAATVICKRLIAKRVQAPEVFASESAAVSCFLSAAYVETGRLTAAISEIDEVKAAEVINLKRKKTVMDAEYTAAQPETAPQPEQTVQEEQAADAPQTREQAEPAAKEEGAPVDEELNRFIAMFKLLRDSNYTLKIVPGTPEENAPVFDFDKQTIIRPAA